jgi:hypothetical protein
MLTLDPEHNDIALSEMQRLTHGFWDRHLTLRGQLGGYVHDESHSLHILVCKDT